MGALSEGFLEHQSLVVRRYNALETAALSLSIATNLISTGMIAWRAWSHHLLLKTTGGTTNAQVSVARVLTLLVESGCAYSIIQVRLAFILVCTSLFNPDLLCCRRCYHSIRRCLCFKKFCH